MAEVEYGDRQCGALGRVGAGAQLVEKTQALTVDTAEDIHDGLHVRRESGEALLDALLVADVGKNVSEKREFATVAGGNMQARHTHEFEETDCFERDGLAAGVGSCDNDHVIIGTQLDIDGNDLFGIDQGMTSLADIDIKFVVENRPGCILLHGQIRARKNKVQLSHILRVILEFHEVLAGFGGERRQDLFNLFLFLQRQFAQLVVEGDDGGWLDEECGAGGRLIMDQSRDLGFVLGLDRDAVAVAAQGDHIVLQIGGIGRIDHLGELLMYFVTCQLHLPAHFAKCRRGIVCHLVLGEDAASDFR